MRIDLHYFKINKARFEKILDFLPYPFLISELRDGTYFNLYLNQKFIQEIGYSVDEIPTINEWFEKAYPNENHREEVKTEWAACFSKAKNEGKDFVLMKALINIKPYGERWYEVKASFFGPIQLVAFIDIHHEIIKEKELIRINHNHNTTLSILSHDLRSPITNLKSLTEMVFNGQLSNEEFIEMIRKLNEKSQQVLDLLDTTLLWTKTNFDSMKIQLEKIDLIKIVNEILSIYEGIYQKKQLSITLAIDSPQPDSDAEIITIVLRNLISNAIKFTPPGGSISIRLEKTEKNYFISVSDTGAGLDSIVSEQILSDDYALNHDIRRGHGHGIGLNLCRQLVEKINGKLKIESEPRKGTVVTIII